MKRDGIEGLIIVVVAFALAASSYARGMHRLAILGAVLAIAFAGIVVLAWLRWRRVAAVLDEHDVRTADRMVRVLGRKWAIILTILAAPAIVYLAVMHEVRPLEGPDAVWRVARENEGRVIWVIAATAVGATVVGGLLLRKHLREVNDFWANRLSRPSGEGQSRGDGPATLGR